MSRDARGGRMHFAIVGLLVLLGLTACRPLYVPAVPDPLPPFAQDLRLTDVRIVRIADRLEVAFEPERVAAPTWVSVQWFPPAGRDVASASVRLVGDSVGRTIRMAFPDDVTRDRPGVWRAILSADGRILRQLEWSEPAGP